MTLPTGTISLSQVNTELGRAAAATISLGETAVRNLAGKSSGAVSMNDLRGKIYVAFSTTPGNYYPSDWGSANWSVSCNVSAVWTYTRVGNTSSNTSTPVSGSSSTSFSTSQVVAGPVGKKVTTTCRVTLYATVAGVQYGPWIVEITAEADDLSQQ